MDIAFIKECADPSLKPAIIERFVELAGSPDPLAITVKLGGRLILVPKPKSTGEAMAIIKQNIRSSIVRVGLTQLPAGIGITDVEDLKPSLVDACENVRVGTTLFAKVLRIVAKWYGNPTNEKVFPQIFEDAIYAWKTGSFDGKNVFLEKEPSGRGEQQEGLVQGSSEGGAAGGSQFDEEKSDQTAESGQRKIDTAGIRIDLSRVGGN